MWVHHIHRQCDHGLIRFFRNNFLNTGNILAYNLKMECISYIWHSKKVILRFFSVISLNVRKTNDNRLKTLKKSRRA